MPASSISAVFTTSIYLLSSALFLSMAYPPLNSEFRASEVKAATSVVDGIQSQIDALVPGMTTSISYGLLTVPASVSFQGNLVEVQLDDTVLTRQVDWSLPSMVLQPGSVYVLELSGGEVQVE